MGIKVSKFIWGDISNISISHFNCTEDNILDIIDLFECETVILEIGDVEKNTSLFQTIKKLSINFKALLHNDLLYSDVVLMVNAESLKELIHHIFISRCESFTIEEIGDYTKWEQYLCNRFNEHQLIKNKIVTFKILIEISESQIGITFRKDTFDSKQVILKIKNQFSHMGERSINHF
ncbi:MAG: hypothetical protein KHW87_08985 [Clostridiales bacterium]|nr:hypothetical protein [Clostridiales bacterium]